jgi:glycosyltransferase involved in cell wall biosynthesis
MVRRGHDVRLAYAAVPPALPRLRYLRSWGKAVISRLRSAGRDEPHHLMESSARVIPVGRIPIRAQDVPDADVSVATWWETMEWISDWPASKGIKAYFVRGYEIFGGDPQRVKATYRMEAIKLVTSSWLKRLMAEEFADDRAVLVPNGVDRKQFDSTPRGKAARPTVGMLYGAMSGKGAQTAFDALRLAQKRIPNLRVIAFGSSPIRPNHVPPANFEYHCLPPQARIPEIYRSADCWLIASVSEGFAMPGLEAAACRCPIVSTRCGGPDDYVKHGESGFLVEVGAIEEMAARILDVVELDEPRWREMSEASYRIAQTFDWDLSAGILENALIAALDGRLK